MNEWRWTFMGYVQNGANIVQVWYDSETPAVRAEFDVALLALHTRGPEEWADMKASRKLKGEFHGLTELKFKVQRVQYRPIGFFGVGTQVFTVLTIATKHDFDSQCRRALRRKPLVQANPGATSNECDCLRAITRKT